MKRINRQLKNNNQKVTDIEKNSFDETQPFEFP